MTCSLSHVLVVGASSGIGKAIALQLAKEGAAVAVLGRRQDALAQVVQEGGERVLAYVHDVCDPASVPTLFERIAQDLGGIDTLIYAAGVMPVVEEGEYPFEKDRQMVEVNLLGAMAWMNMAAGFFEAARGGTILGISSLAGERGRRANPAYCATKAGLTTYLESLRNRCSRFGVNVVTAKPGFVDTAMTKGKPGLFWLVSAEEAARQILALAKRGSSASGCIPARWFPVVTLLRWIPSWLFRQLNV